MHLAKFRYLALILFVFAWQSVCLAKQNPSGIAESKSGDQKPANTKPANQAVHQGEMGFPEFRFPAIPGAPKLSRPIMVMGSARPILTEKHGLASPAIWDWNKDGKNDLLVGEFETSDDESNIRIYLNIGSKSEPEFSDKFTYAKDTKGNLITVKQW